MHNFNPQGIMMPPQDINIRITGKPAADLRHLAQQLGVTPEDVVADALRLLRTTVDNRLYVTTGRLTSQAPAMYALGFWSNVIDQGATGRIEVNTRRGSVAFQLPKEAFHRSQIVGT